ncbi:MAG TPA: basic amino acid ABC transporter substrate-binding protein, partial [Devosia sp.]|nr:basic amino acid ABC transporter substrate-binding protein [Devosia sp.]
MPSITRLLAAAAAVSALGFGAVQAQDALPDLGGRTIVAVTENAYVPLNFADPATGEGIG